MNLYFSNCLILFILGIRIRATGKAEANPILQPASEKFRIHESYLVGNENNDDEIELTEGTHTYNFQIFLTGDLPSSFESDPESSLCNRQSFIRYEIRVLVDNFFTQEFEKKFNIVAHLDLNSDPSLKEPVNKFMNKRFYSLLTCCTGKLKFNVYLPARGFVPMEKIPIKAECINNSGVAVGQILVILRQRNNYHEIGVTPEMVNLRELEIGSVGPTEKKDFNFEFEIPSMQPLTTINCKYIFVHYEFLFRLIVNPFHRDLRGTIPIVIGTMPIIPDFQPPPNFRSMLLQDEPHNPSGCKRHYEWYGVC